jgi:hypothetical protein
MRQDGKNQKSIWAGIAQGNCNEFFPIIIEFLANMGWSMPHTAITKDGEL